MARAGCRSSTSSSRMLCLAVVARGADRPYPSAFAGFFYHAHMLAVVHLLTLGWITSHILGALYLIAPMALRNAAARDAPRHASPSGVYAIGVDRHGRALLDRRDAAACCGSAPLVLATIALVGARTAARTPRRADRLRSQAPLRAGVRQHDRRGHARDAARLEPSPSVPRRGAALTISTRTSHLAALGWATMTVFGSAQRLLPMLLPSALPPPRRHG